MAIVAILIGIAIPAIQRSRSTARATTCANNMRQLVLQYIQVDRYVPSRLINVCPTDPDERAGRELFGSYSVSTVGLRESPTWSAVQSNQSNTILLYERAAGIHFGTNTNPLMWYQVTQPLHEIDAQRHLKTFSNYAYFDGHVERIDWTQMDFWITREFNFGLPGNGRPDK